jgi:hypothetical protein
VTWGNVGRAAWIALIFTLASLGMAKLNLFGLEAGSGQRADDVAQRLGIVGYHYPDHSTPRPGQDAVRVIHIDDDGLNNLRPDWSGWPPGYENLAIMIEDVARAPGIPPARGVFVDLEITGENLTDDNRPEFEELVAAIGRLTRAGTKENPGWASAEACLLDPLTKLACMIEWGGVPIILAGGEGVETGHAKETLGQVAVLAPTLVDQRSYPLVGPEADDETETKFLLYPAAAMYAVDCLVRARAVRHDVCGVPAVETARLAARTLRADPDAAPSRPTLKQVQRSWKRPEAVVWSSDASPRQAALWKQVGGNEIPTCVARLPVLERLWTQAMGEKAALQGDRQACSYTLSLGYDRIVAGLGLSRDRDYPDLLSDKLVMIGVQFRNSDWVPTPLHGALPGVQYHAMALDNLLEFGRGYRRDEGQGLGWGDVFASCITFFLLFAINLASIEKRVITGRRGALKPLAAAIWYGGLWMLIIAGLTLFVWITANWWSSVTVNWIGILGTIAGAFWFTARSDIRHDLTHWLKRSRTGKAMVSAAAQIEQSLQPVPTASTDEKP